MHRCIRNAEAEDVVLQVIWEYPEAWVASYNTRVFVETGSARHALAGNGPIIIDKTTGAARIGTSTISIDDQVAGEGVMRWTAATIGDS